MFRTLVRTLRLACPAIAALALAAADTAAAVPEPHVIGQFKEWVLVCADIDGKPETPEECYLNDVASARKSPPSQVAVAIGLAQAKTGGRVLALQFAFKPGIDRASAFEVSIDSTPVMKGAVGDCNAENCLSAVAPVAPQMLDEMKRGSVMEVAFKVEGGGVVRAPISLSGFTAAVTALQDKNPAAAAAAARSTPAPTGIPPTAKFRDWSLYCADADGSAATPESCRLNQVVLSTEPGKSIMAANIGYAKVDGSDQKTLTLVLMFPPATDKEAGVGIMIDDKQLGSGPIAACTAEFCHAIIVLKTEHINLMKQGTKMTVLFTLKDKGKVGAPLSLLGITAAIDALIKRS